MILAGVCMSNRDGTVLIVLQMLFTVFCAALLRIEAHGGGTHVTNVPQLEDLTKVGHILELYTVT